MVSGNKINIKVNFDMFALHMHGSTIIREKSKEIYKLKIFQTMQVFVFFIWSMIRLSKIQ